MGLATEEHVKSTRKLHEDLPKDVVAKLRDPRVRLHNPYGGSVNAKDLVDRLREARDAQGRR